MFLRAFVLAWIVISVIGILLFTVMSDGPSQAAIGARTGAERAGYILGYKVAVSIAVALVSLLPAVVVGFLARKFPSRRLPVLCRHYGQYSKLGIRVLLHVWEQSIRAIRRSPRRRHECGLSHSSRHASTSYSATLVSGEKSRSGR